MNERPSAYLDEIAWFIWDEYEVVISESGLSRVLKRMNWSRKVVYPHHFGLRNPNYPILLTNSATNWLQNAIRKQGTTGFDVWVIGKLTSLCLLMKALQTKELWIKSLVGLLLDIPARKLQGCTLCRTPSEHFTSHHNLHVSHHKDAAFHITKTQHFTTLGLV